MEQAALLIIDIQNDYFTGGKMALEGMEKAAANAQQLLEHFRKSRKPVFHIQHFSTRPGSTFFLPDTTGVEIHALVTPEKDEPVISKNFPNSFRETSLHEQLMQKNVKQLTICGAMSHMCVDTTVRAAFDLGYGCRVVSDACATRKLEIDGTTVSAANVHAAFMAALSVPFAQIVKTGDIVDQAV